jgi:hypothetical protein
MASNMECIGLDVADEEALDRLLDRVLPDAVELGRWGGVQVLRWEDPSGARLVLGLRRRELVEFLPSFAGAPGIRLRRLRPAGDLVAVGDVVDDEGEQLSALAAGLEEYRALEAGAVPEEGAASLVALGVGVRVHADPEAFAADDDSLLDAESARDEPPPGFEERGGVWPLRMASQSFVSYGIFAHAGGEQAYALARLAGHVEHAERRTVHLTGQTFHACRITLAGFEADVCLPATEHPDPPYPGQVLHGRAYLVLTLPTLPPQRHRWRWRR